MSTTVVADISAVHNGEKFGGAYRPKRVSLEIYEAIQETIRTIRPCQTRLDPPRADPRCSHPARQQGQMNGYGSCAVRHAS